MKTCIMKKNLFTIGLLSCLAFLPHCSSTNPGIEVGNPSTDKITVTSTGSNAALVTIPESFFSDLTDSRIDIFIDDEIFVLGINPDDFYNGTEQNVAFTITDDAIEAVALLKSKNLSRGLSSGASLGIIINAEDKTASKYAATFSSTETTEADFTFTDTVNGAALIVDAICDRINECEPASLDVPCTEDLIVHKTIGDVFLETFGSDDSIDDNVSLQDIYEGVESGIYSFDFTGVTFDACITWIQNRTCSGEETSVDNAYNSSDPTNYANVENMIADDGDCGRIVTVN